jgi:hypothetical protein
MTRSLESASASNSKGVRSEKHKEQDIAVHAAVSRYVGASSLSEMLERGCTKTEKGHGQS